MRATEAEQLTVLMTPMKLRVATCPSARRMPSKVRAAGAGAGGLRSEPMA